MGTVPRPGTPSFPPRIMTVRTRFAPSPTGYLHIGGVRTALFCWLFARHNGGQFILRIDDTDQERNVEEALAPILHGLRWLGIDWDEGPEVGGPHAPYYQSQRGERYRAAVERLLAVGAAYYDYATPEEQKAEREAAQREKRPFVASRRFMAQTPADRARFEAQGRRSVVRLKMPRQGTLVIRDLVRGNVEIQWAGEQDHVIQRADGSCLYHLASVVDDHDFQITHVIRAEEHLSNTPRQIFIAHSLGYDLPSYAHLPFVAEPGSKNKLSKRKLDKYLKNPDFAELMRHGRKVAEALGLHPDAETFNPVSVDFYEQVGYLPEALVNYLALLGWSLDDKTEDFSRQELIENFSLERVGRAAASFDPKKLRAVQERYMQRLPIAEKVARVVPYLERAALVPTPLPEELRPKVEQVVAAAGDRIKTAGDVLDYGYFFRAPNLDQSTLTKHISTREDGKNVCVFRESIRQHYGANLDVLRRDVASRSYAPFDDATNRLPPTANWEAELAAAEEIEAGLVNIDAVEHAARNRAAENACRVADVIHKVRFALTGTAVGVGLFVAIRLIGRDESVARIDRALTEAGFPESRLAAGRPPVGSGNRQTIGTNPGGGARVFDFSEPGKPISLFRGQLTLVGRGGSVTGNGEVELQFTPNPALAFRVASTPPWPLRTSNEVALCIPESAASVPALITNMHITSDAGVESIRGITNGRVVFGAGEALRHVVFHVADFADYFGTPVRGEVLAGGAWAGRLSLGARDWVITIDAVRDARNRREAASKCGAVPVTHVGMIEKRDSVLFSPEDCGEVAEGIRYFLSFVRGQWVAPLLVTGFGDHGKRVWQDWTPYITPRYPGFESWCPVQDMRYVESFFPGFFERWVDPEWRAAMKFAIGSYVHSNMQGVLDDSIVTAQMTLETLAEFVLVEQAAARESAPMHGTGPQKIAQLLSLAHIPSDIPDPLHTLKEFAEKEHLGRGLDAVIRIRDACVHPTLEARRLISRLASSKPAFYDATRLALWYSDLCMLWLLGYEGRYQSRVHGEWVGETEPVPWKEPLPYPLKSNNKNDQERNRP